MCGIVGYVGAQQAAPILLEGLQKLEYRGYDSAGIAVLDGSTIELAKACGVIKNLFAKTHDGEDLHGYIGLGHTRWATHGAPTEANAHPHVSNDGKFAIVQNGIIENFMELREMLKAKGFVFHSETDTEVIVHLLDMYYTGDGNLKDTVLKTLGRLEGSYALGILCADCPDQLFIARNGCPLIIGVGAGENFFASDVTALVSHTKNVIYLEDGELAEVRANSYTVFDCTGKPIDKPVSRVAWDIEAAEKGGYEHFMLKEIMEQPRAIDLNPQIAQLAERYKNNPSLFFIGRNVDYAVCMEGSLKLKEISYLHSEAYAAGELKHGTIALIEENRLVIAVACYEPLFDKTMSNVKEVKARGARVLGVALEGNRAIYSEADDVILVPRMDNLFVVPAEIVPLQLFAYYVAKANGCAIDKPKNLAKSVTVE